jgi:tetratricopeptide (TPR) repeat protein
MKKGAYDEAITDLTRVLEQDPENIEALYSRGNFSFNFLEISF